MKIEINKEYLQGCIRKDFNEYYSLIISCPDEIGLDKSNITCCKDNCKECWIKALDNAKEIE